MPCFILKRNFLIHFPSYHILATFQLRACLCNLQATLQSWNNGVGFRRVATALSESSSIQSDALYHLTRDMSGMGLDPLSYSSLEPEPYKYETWTEESQSLLQVN
ncbi:hypothetical protein Q8A73_022182 [Channa argus]|nr:hypothetical protein Q8A73_022182 [Channa argus]